MSGNQAQGIFCGVAAAVCYGMNPLGATFLYAGGLTPDSALFYRYAFAALLLGAWLAARGEGFRLTRREAGVLALLGALFSVSSLTFFESFRVMDTGLACTLLFVYPVMVAAIMAACFGERLTWPTGAALALGLVSYNPETGGNDLYYHRSLARLGKPSALIVIGDSGNIVQKTVGGYHIRNWYDKSVLYFGHSGRANAVMADGHAATLIPGEVKVKYSISGETGWIAGALENFSEVKF